MKSSVIFQKKHKDDDEGYLYIRYFNGSGKKKLVSLNYKINKDHFKDLFYDDINQFKKTTIINYREINSKISSKINDFSIFDDKKNTKTSFVVYFRDYTALQRNPSTSSNYNSVLKKLENYKVKKNKEDILFSDFDYSFVVDFKNYLLETLSVNTTKQYINVIKTILNLAKKEGLYIEKFNYFEDLNLKPTHNNKKILQQSDIETLLNISFYHDFENTIESPLFETRNMLLTSIFCSGIRVSDLLLMRKGDLKETHIEIFTKKTSDYLRVPYNETLLKILFDNYGYFNSKTLKYNSKSLKYEFFDFIKNINDNDFIFSNFLSTEPVLNDYNKDKEMTTEQFNAINRLRVKYNNNLIKLKDLYNLDIVEISSHTGRYSWTNILLNIEGVNLLDISRSLTHKNIGTTESYIERNHGLDRMKNIGDLVSNKVYKDNNENHYSGEDKPDNLPF
ncbi:tyrosine-type recombinase/integrase [Flavobacterium gilvum]|uniref:Core-binding (CB) domain-containing protein n=1 Tax=Flavobacterium gilvum TaxID=1492737 RepID=A0AAC9I1Q7_9FLAO|nr:site-specific integrase [Flavobacterium gilvum]AOW08431.1 hypothetical protein EM308_02345 [Flavobacterium gilvum]KFC61125.1 hypothetical protein FEM08_01090 [Flavobacterium gilvum]